MTINKPGIMKNKNLTILVVISLGLVLAASVIMSSQAATPIKNPPVPLIEGPVKAKSEGKDTSGTDVRWILPGKRALNPKIYGTPLSAGGGGPLGFEPDIGVKVADRDTFTPTVDGGGLLTDVTEKAILKALGFECEFTTDCTAAGAGLPIDPNTGTAVTEVFTNQATPLLFSNRHDVIKDCKKDCHYKYEVEDRTIFDDPASKDKVDFHAKFLSPVDENDETHSYKVTVKKSIPVGPVHPFMGGVGTNFVHHGITANRV